MLRVAAVLVFAFIGTVSAQVLTSPNNPDQQRSSSNTDNPPRPSEQTAQQKQSPSKMKRKMQGTIPDCVNLIFYRRCNENPARKQEATEKREQQLAEAAERCRQLSESLPQSLRPIESPTASYCTPEDVITADHDVDVGDFYFKENNLRAAEMRYRSALERLPGEPIATLHLARLLQQSGKRAEAYEQYKRFMAWDPSGKDAEEAAAAISQLEKELAQK